MFPHPDFPGARRFGELCLKLLGLTLLIVASGCAGETSLGTIQGTIQYKGQPIAYGKIVFEVPGARPATGTIIGGRISEVTTYHPGDGAPVGLARIAIFCVEPVDPSATDATPLSSGSALPSGYMGVGAKSLIPSKYQNPEESGLTLTIAPGRNDLNLDLQD